MQKSLRKFGGRERLGMRIRRLREEKSWTQEDLAGHTGIDRPFISLVENGKKEICFGTMESLANAFEITISDLLKGI